MISTSLGRAGRARSQASWTPVAEAEFRRGLVTDTAPVALPTGAVADVRDFLFDRPGKIRKRGGTVRWAGPFAGQVGTAHVSFAPFASGDKVIVVTNNSGGTYSVWDAAVPGTTLGALGSFSAQPPVFYNDTLYILLGASFAPGRPSIVKSPAGLASSGDSVAPVAYVGCVHGGYLVLGNDTGAHQNRLWFSPIPDPETTWDTSNAYIDTNGPITGLASIQGVLVVFHAGSCERVLGSIPPGTVGENMSLQPLSGQGGCVDPGSVRSIGGNVYFADHSGVWVTNGATISSLTSKADGTGVSGLWRESISAVLNAGHPLAIRAGTFGNEYYLAGLLEQDSGWTTRLFLVYQIATGVWTRFTIEPFSDFAASLSSLETFAAPTNQPWVEKISDLFADTPTRTSDANGEPVQPIVQSRVIGQGPFVKAYGDGHLTYDMRSSAGAYLTLSLSKDIEQQSFPATGAYTAVTGPTRQRFPVSGDGHGFSFKLAQAGYSTKTEIYAVEVEQRSYGEQADG